MKRVGALNYEIVKRYVDDLVTLPDEQIFEAVVWIMSHVKVVPEGAAAPPSPRCCRGWYGRAGDEGGLRPQRRQRQPRPARRPPLELGVKPGSDRGQTTI